MTVTGGVHRIATTAVQRTPRHCGRSGTEDDRQVPG